MGSFISRKLPPRPSIISSRPLWLLPMLASSLMASSACRLPTSPTTGASTPASTQVRDCSPNRALRQGLPAPLDHDLLAETIAGKLPVAAAEQDLAPLASSIQLLSRQLEEQSRLIREQHRLIQRLASAPARQGAAGAEAEPLVEDLSSQVANMKKVKAKGIF